MYSLAESSNNVKEVCVSIQLANLDFCVTIELYYGSNSFLGKAISQKYLLHISSAYGIKCLGEIYKQMYHLKFFCANSFDDSMGRQNLWCCGSISPKTVFIFYKNFLNFRFDEIEE